MKMRIAATMALLATAALWTPTATAQAANDEAKIRALEARFADAFNAKDADSIMKVYVPDASLVVFDVVPPRQYVGAHAYRKDWQDFFAHVNGPLKFEIGDLAVTTDGRLGYSHSIQRVSGTDSKGHPIDLTVRVTDVYRKIKGQWLIEHEHISVPIDPNTGKPEFASKP